MKCSVCPVYTLLTPEALEAACAVVIDTFANMNGSF